MNTAVWESISQVSKKWSRDLGITQLIKRNRRKKMPAAYVSDRYRAAYIPLPKVASSSVKLVLCQHGFRPVYGPSLDFSKFGIRFAIVRNPWERLLSCYFDKIKNYGNQPQTNRKDGFYLPFKRYKDIYHDMPFDKFVKAVATIPDYEADVHFQSQYIRLTDSEGQLIPNNILRFEQLSEGLQVVFKDLGLREVELPAKRKTKAVDYKQYYDEETMNLIRSRYREDLLHFGYQW